MPWRGVGRLYVLLWPGSNSRYVELATDVRESIDLFVFGRSKSR